jgi:glucose/mannose transport system substrate-binding protein
MNIIVLHMGDHTMWDATDRRTLLKLAGVVGAGSMAGCTSNSESSSEGSSERPFELLHPWTGGSAAEAIDEVIAGFKEEHPDMPTDFNPVGATGSVQLFSLVNQRLSNGNPPGSWQGFPGDFLNQYASDDETLLGDISDSVWTENNMEESFLQETKELSKLNGNYVCVPIETNRLNNLYFNLDVIEDAGVDPRSLETPSDLIPLFEAVEAETDAAGMAQSMTNANTQLSLWEVTHLGIHGHEAYNAFLSGNGDVSRIEESLEVVAQMSDFFNDDAATIAPQEANQKIIDGNAGFYQQGTWMAGGYNTADLEYQTDWDWVPFPGTGDDFVVQYAAFIYPDDNPTPEKTKKFLRYSGTKEAQVTFNSIKGGIPCRTDTSSEEFGPFLTKIITDFSEVQNRPPSIAHGLALPQPETIAIRGVLSDNFMGPYNISDTAQGLLDAVSS